MPEEIGVGAVVRSAAGHDRGGVFAVVSLADSAFAMLADGKRRKLEKPKKKKRKHLVLLGSLAQPVLQGSNRMLRAALREFEAAHTQGTRSAWRP